VYLAGTTSSPDFPATANAFQASPQGQQDGFAAKFDFSTTAATTLISSASALGFFSYQTASGNITPATQTISVASTGAPISFSSAAATVGGGNWLSISVNSNTTPSTITVSVNPAGLPQGYYSGIVSIVAPGVINGHSLIGVTLNISRPFLSVTSNSLTFTYTPGGAVPACQSLSLSTFPAAPLAFTNVSTNAGWLSATPASGNLPATLTVCVNPAGYPNGTYAGEVYILAPYASDNETGGLCLPG